MLPYCSNMPTCTQMPMTIQNHNLDLINIANPPPKRTMNDMNAKRNVTYSNKPPTLSNQNQPIIWEFVVKSSARQVRYMYI